MSLISLKNFIAPFTNTVHAVTIILVTVLFALFRLQGGGVSATSPQKARESRIEIEQPIFETLRTKKTEPQKIPDKGTIEISREEEDLIKQMIGNKPLDEKPSKPAKSSKTSGGGSLDDIEKSLGMR